MANICCNYFTIRGDTKIIQKLIDASEHDFLAHMVPHDPENGIYADWGTTRHEEPDWDQDIYLGNGQREVTGMFNSGWTPPILAFEQYAKKHPSLYIELTYDEPGMQFFGIWDSDGRDEYYEWTPEEHHKIPQHLREQFDVDEEIAWLCDRYPDLLREYFPNQPVGEVMDE